MGLVDTLESFRWKEETRRDVPDFPERPVKDRITWKEILTVVERCSVHAFILSKVVPLGSGPSLLDDVLGSSPPFRI